MFGILSMNSWFDVYNLVTTVVSKLTWNVNMSSISVFVVTPKVQVYFMFYLIL